MTHSKQSGLVSIIVVMFTAILLMVVSTGFIRIMVQEESRASNNNLSRTAYESAVAGVEDGKRAIMACQRGGSASAACKAIAAKRCSTIQDAGIISSISNTAITIKSGTNLQYISGQAYTCVLIDSQTSDVVYSLKEGSSRVVPLRVNKDTSMIRLQWMMKNDKVSTISSADGGDTLPKRVEWPADAPALLRIQAVVPESTTVNGQQSFDSSIVSTAFLRPSGIRAPRNLLDSTTFNVVAPQSVRAAGSATNATAGVSPITCSAEAFDNHQYACSAYVTLPRNLVAGNPMAFLRITSIYNDTDVRLSFDNIGDGTIKFDGVQPKVDSTGRAGDVYRRVSSRISSSSNINYPESAVDITGSLCKDFSVTNQGVPSALTCKVIPEEQ